MLTSLYIDFSDAQGQLTPKSVVEFRQNLNIWLNSVHSFLRYGAKNKLLNKSCVVTLLQICEKQRFTIPTRSCQYDVKTKFGLILSICSYDIEYKTNSDINQGQ